MFPLIEILNVLIILKKFKKIIFKYNNKKNLIII